MTSASPACTAALSNRRSRPLAVTLAMALVTVTSAGAALAAPPPPGVPVVGPQADPTGATVRKFALIFSANDGGQGRATLRFADSDARAVAEVLENLGGLDKQDLVLLPRARRGSLTQAFAQMQKTIAAAGGGRARRDLFVYYSGHSDEEGLLLGGERVPYQELRQWIVDVGADVRIAVLDSCASGALIRLRGGNLRAPFLQDVSTSARGHAFLTASSADEAAQESDRIGAAFFTHFLVSGLRGAADTSRDGQVTLNEAYQFAYHETLSRTERTAAGAQHPAYDIQLAGTGDLVMTSLRATNAALVLDEKVVGRVYVRDASGRLMAELRKEPMFPIELGLPPGEYRVNIDNDGRPFAARVTLSEGKRTRVSTADMKEERPLVATARGGSSGETEAVIATPGTLAVPYRHVPFEGVLVPGVRSSGGGDGRPVLNNFVLGVVGHSHALEGMQLSIGGNMVEERMTGVQLALGFNLTRGPATGVQLTSGANVALGDFRGVQIGDFANVTLGQARGVQLGMVNWAAKDHRGVQVGVGNHIGASHRGVQIGVANHTGGHLAGPQIGVVNGARGGLRGLQVGVVNGSGGVSEGAQIGVIGVAGHLRGPQIAVLNVGHTVDGPQIGVINVASKIRGAQIGVLNVADSVDGASIGLLNIIGDGYHQVAAWSSDMLPSNLGFKLGSRHVYTILGGGIGKDDNRTLYAVHAGIGIHANLAPKLYLDVDALQTSFAYSDDWLDNSIHTSLRTQVGYRLLPYLSVTLGPTYNVHIRDVTQQSFERKGLGWLDGVSRNGDWEVRHFPGFMIGLQVGGGGA